jgi:hypothetical protein
MLLVLSGTEEPFVKWLFCKIGGENSKLLVCDSFVEVKFRCQLYRSNKYNGIHGSA